jgi:hypothetical protein
MVIGFLFDCRLTDLFAWVLVAAMEEGAFSIDLLH